MSGTLVSALEFIPFGVLLTLALGKTYFGLELEILDKELILLPFLLSYLTSFMSKVWY